MANQPKQTEASHQQLQSKSLYKAQTRRTLALAGQEELKLRKIEGELVDLELIRRGLTNVILNQRTILLTLPAQIGREIDEPEMRVRILQVVDRRVREALEALSNYDPVIPNQSSGAGEADDAGDAEPDQAAAMAQHEPVGRTTTLSQPRRRRQCPMAQ